MRRGKRYNKERKLNIKKVIAVPGVLILIVLFIMAIKSMLGSESASNNLISTTYFLLNENNKWGVIDNNSKIIIEPTYEETIIIPNNKKDIFICTYNVDYENGTFKTKVLNSKKQEIFTQYNNIFAVENYDENNNLWYENNLLIVEKEGKFGLINFDGNEITSIDYQKIYSLKGIQKSLITVKEEKLGLINNIGEQIIENKYQDIKSLGKDTNLYIVKENNLYGIYNTLECKYQDIKSLNNKNVYCVKENNEYKVINAEGEVVFKEKFSNITQIADNIIVYNYKNNYCAYNLNTNTKLEKTYKDLIYTQDNLFVAKEEEKYGIINMQNELKFNYIYTTINYYSDVKVYELIEDGSNVNIVLNSSLNQIIKGIVSETNSKKSYIRVWTEEGYKYFSNNGEEKMPKYVLTNNNLFLSKQNNKYGYVDKNGNIIVDYIYDDATEQNDYGYISVKKDGLWGSLDKNGNVICQTKYNLDNNLVIDFIGQYHLGVDLNLNYYTNNK